MSDTTLRTIPVTPQLSPDQRDPGLPPRAGAGLPAGLSEAGWLARHRVEVLATGAALAATALGVKAKDSVLRWSADHPRTVVGAGVALGGAAGATLAALSGVRVEPLVIKAADGAAETAAKAAGVVKEAVQSSRPLTLAGGALAGAAAGALIGQLLARHAAGKQALPPDGPEKATEDEARMPAGWLARLRHWAAHRTDESQAEPLGQDA